MKTEILYNTHIVNFLLNVLSHLVFTETVNECQFIFYVHSFLMPQKLRGTITYMIKVRGIISCKYQQLMCFPVGLD